MGKDTKILYHASYIAIEKINFSKCRDGLDFGRGFYTTDDYKQAKSFIKNAIKKGIMIGDISKNTKYGYINVFEFSNEDNLKIYKFKDANNNWLHYVASNRNTNLFKNDYLKYKNYDILIGKIANDKTAETLNNYVAGAYGNPGDKSTDEFTINRLMTNILKDQYCFKTSAAIKKLKFLKSEKVYV